MEKQLYFTTLGLDLWKTYTWLELTVGLMSDGDGDYDDHDKRLFFSFLLFASHSQVRSHYIYTTTHRQPTFWRII